MFVDSTSGCGRPQVEAQPSALRSAVTQINDFGFHLLHDAMHESFHRGFQCLLIHLNLALNDGHNGTFNSSQTRRQVSHFIFLPTSSILSTSFPPSLHVASDCSIASLSGGVVKKTAFASTPDDWYAFVMVHRLGERWCCHLIG